MTDESLLAELDRVIARSRRADAELVAHLAEADARGLYLGQGCPSMHAYCTDVLHMSDPVAYLRIAVARAVRKHPALLDMLADGRLHLSGIAKLAPHLTPTNRDHILTRAAHHSKRQLDELLAELAPKPDAPAVIRKLPTPRAPAAPTPGPLFQPAPAPATVPTPTVTPAPALVTPLAPARFKVQFTASAELEEKLTRLKNEMRHQVPDGDLATLIEIAVTDKLAALEKRRYARTTQPRKHLADADPTPTGRAIPAPIKRAVRERDGDQCTFVSDNGRRCRERGALELHHDDPFGKGGEHSVDNLRLLCRAHNQHLAVRDYGAAHMHQFRSRAEEPRPALRPAVPQPTAHWLGLGLPRNEPHHAGLLLSPIRHVFDALAYENLPVLEDGG